MIVVASRSPFIHTDVPIALYLNKAHGLIFEANLIRQNNKNKSPLQHPIVRGPFIYTDTHKHKIRFQHTS